MKCMWQEFYTYQFYYLQKISYKYEKFIDFLREKDEKYENILLKPIPFLNSSHQVDWIYSLFNIEDFDNFIPKKFTLKKFTPKKIILKNFTPKKFTPKKFLVISEKKETSIKLNDISIIEFIPITKEEFEKAIKDFLGQKND